MTIREQLALIDATVPNRYSREVKIAWLNTLDHMVFKEVIERHEGGDKLLFNGYSSETPESTELLVPEPYCELYGYYIEAKIHYLNGETQRYTNAMTMFNAVYADFGKWYTSCHAPKRRTRFRLF